MAGEKFYLIFSDEPLRRVQINEPIRYSEVDFNLDRRENGMGLDVSLSGGTTNFRFTFYRHGLAFKKLLYYAHYYGFESDVKLIIVLSNGTEFIGELDFVMAESDDYKYFDCPVILESETQVFRRRADTKVDLFANTTIDGETIEPLQPVNILLQAKPSIQYSEWEQNADFFQNLSSNGSAVTTWYMVNPVSNLLRSEIKDTYTFFENYNSSRRDPFTDSNFKLFLAQTNLKNVTLSLRKIKIHFETDVDNNGNGFVNLKLAILKGIDWLNATETVLFTANRDENQSYDFEGDFLNVNIGNVQRGESVWVYYFFEVRQSTDVVIGGTPRFEVFTTIYKGANLTVKAESSAYNSITPAFRLIDVMKQVAKSISGLNLNAPRFDVGGEHYNNIITNGNLLRNITDKPFYVSWEDLFDKSIAPELNADSEIQIDKRVFVGIEDDFFTTDECGYFPNTQFSQLLRKPNPKYCLNSFNYKYENYQSLKENTEPNSDSTIHGQSIFTPFNKKVENGKELSIKWIRDSILLDVQQRLSTSVSKDTATQDDDKIFVIDTIETENDQKFSESTTLQHTFLGDYLSLRSNGEVNFNVLGIRTESVFTIQYPDANTGTYLVVSVQNTELQLQRTSSGTISSSGDGIRLTKYTYEIKKETIPLTNRTNEGFGVILNLLSPEKYSNLRYSVQRNIRNYWNRFLATVNIYHKEKPLKNTFYKNNGSCKTEYNNLLITEKEDWLPDNPIVTPYMYENVIFANVDFSKFLTLQEQLRTRRGFIRTIDNNSRVLKMYPLKMSYENRTRQLTITGQEKFESTYMTIVTEPNNIVINNETRVKRLIYDTVILDRDKQVILFDLERTRLYNGVYWDKVSVNGVIYDTVTELKNQLDLLGV